MRTTIEIKPQHGARLLEIAASRGKEDLSTVIAEALDFYLRMQQVRTKNISRALALKGTMKESESARLLADARKIRADW